MAGPLFYDRVLETSTTTGTGTYALAGAVTGFQAWAAVGNTNTGVYFAEEVDGNGVPSGGWEVGLGTYTSSGTTLARTVVYASSNAGAAVNWSAGTRRIGLCEPAAYYNQQCMVTNSANQSIPNNTDTALTFDTETFDGAGMHSTSSNTSRITVNYPGRYFFAGGMLFAGGSTGVRVAFLYKNGTTRIGEVGQAGDVTNGNRLCPVGFADMAAGDYVELWVFQNNGGALNSQVATAFPYFQCSRVG